MRGTKRLKEEMVLIRDYQDSPRILMKPLVPSNGDSVFLFTGGHGQSSNKMGTGKGECLIARSYFYPIIIENRNVK